MRYTPPMATFSVLPYAPNPTLGDLGLTCAHFIGPSRLSDAALKEVITGWYRAQPYTRNFSTANWLDLGVRIDALLLIMLQTCQIQDLSSQLAACQARLPRPVATAFIGRPMKKL